MLVDKYKLRKNSIFLEPGKENHAVNVLLPVFKDAAAHFISFFGGGQPTLLANAQHSGCIKFLQNSNGPNDLACSYILEQLSHLSSIGPHVVRMALGTCKRELSEGLEQLCSLQKYQKYLETI